MRKIILHENENGTVYRISKIPNTMFNFYILKNKQFKDGTNQYLICVELATDPLQKHWTLDKIRGHKEDAVRRLDEIINNQEEQRSMA